MGTLNSALPVPAPGSPTTPAGTATAPSAKDPPQAGGLGQPRAVARPLLPRGVHAAGPSWGAIAYQNKALVYGLLFKVAAETAPTIAADPKRLWCPDGVTAVLHTWGQLWITTPMLA